jgi:ABC-type thiamin/hydroxymethylpyrimidine transport system permease subunit
MESFVKVLISIILQAFVGYFLALYVIYIFETPQDYQEMVASLLNAIGIWSMGFFLSGLNNHLEGIHIIARLVAALFGAFIGSIIVYLLGSTHWLEIPLIPIVLSLIGYHFIFFIKAR